jgi:hypothetical protein
MANVLTPVDQLRDVEAWYNLDLMEKYVPNPSDFIEEEDEKFCHPWEAEAVIFEKNNPGFSLIIDPTTIQE